MPVLSRDPAKQPANPQPVIKPVTGIAVDSQIEHRRNLLTHAEGSKWVVQYFNQITTPDSEPSAQEINRSAAYQQYLQVHNFEVRVTSPLTASLSTDANEFSHTGEATVFPGTIIPILGDMFIADAGDGRAGLFVIKDAPEQLSIMRDTGWRISYGLKSYADGLVLADLKDKTVKVGHFVKDFIAIGKNPILVSSEYEALQTLRAWIAKIPEDYYTAFFNREYNTFLIPDQELTTYDSFLTDFIVKIFNPAQHPQYAHVNQLNCEPGDPEPFETIWDALETLNERPLEYGKLQMTVCAARGYWQHPRYASVRYSGIQEFLLPKGSASAELVDTNKSITESPARVSNRPLDLDKIIFDSDLEGLRIDPDEPPYYIPIIHPLPQGYWYVFSQAFYHRDISGMSLLEQMVYKRLNNVSINLDQLLRLCNTSTGWKNLERFYYQPILYVLVVSAIGDIN